MGAFLTEWPGEMTWRKSDVVIVPKANESGLAKRRSRSRAHPGVSHGELTPTR